MLKRVLSNTIEALEPLKTYSITVRSFLLSTVYIISKQRDIIQSTRNILIAIHHCFHIEFYSLPLVSVSILILFFSSSFFFSFRLSFAYIRFSFINTYASTFISYFLPLILDDYYLDFGLDFI